MSNDMHYAEFYRRVEKWLIGAVRSCYPASWDENHITYSIVDMLFARCQSVSLTGLDRPFKIIWDSRKLRLPEEADYGDIAILVRLTTWAGDTLEGVGLLEAKRRDSGKASFSSVRVTQLKRILRKSPSSRLLLYDYDNVSSCMDNVAAPYEDYFANWRSGHIEPYTHSVCVSTGLALSRNQFTTGLHKFGVPLAHQLVARYFRGLDLEMDEETVNAVKGNITRHGGPRALILVGVSTGDGEPVLPEVNSGRYVQE
jgi:hypothetical protein